MGYAQIQTCTVLGLKAPAVTVEVHLANGLPNFALVGLADTEVREARERVRSAILNSGLEFPSNKRIIVNLAPADLPKESGRFDLPIAVGILAASEQLDAQAVEQHVFAGELSLSGELRPVRGALAMALGLQANKTDLAWVLPPGSAEEAALLPDARVYRAQHLRDVVQAFALPGQQTHDGESGWSRVLSGDQPKQDGAENEPDLQQVRGQAAPKRALEIAAAGGHSVLLIGPPGSGKSMLAQRLAGLLPTMSRQQALESAAMLSLAGQFHPARWARRAYRHPHHSATMAALVGGGSPPRPGEISLAHHGLLFLEELPEYSRLALEALREPLENGRISLSRARHQAEFPAQFQLIAAMNPCPCGYLGSKQPACRCVLEQVARYQGKLSGPLLDRIDMQVHVPAMPADLLMQAPAGESSASVQARCQQAQQHVQQQAARQGWSARAVHRVLRVAQTIADLAQAEEIELSHVMQAMYFRMALQP